MRLTLKEQSECDVLSGVAKMAWDVLSGVT